MPKYRITTQLTVVQSREWTIDAEDEDTARAAFEEDSDNACFMMEETIKIIGDESVVSVVAEPTAEQRAIILSGVKNLNYFGYPKASEHNIMTDMVYRKFFRGMLEDNLGKGADEHIQPLIDRIDAADKAEN